MRSLQTGLALAVGVGLGFAIAGRAQDMYPNLAPATLDVYMSSHIDGLSLKNTGKGKSGGNDQSRKGGVALGTARATTAYTPSPSVSAQVRDKAIKRVRAISSADADKMAAALQKNTVATLWQHATVDYGLHTNDMADAMAAYWVINYMVVSDVPDVPAASVQGARNQFKRLLVGTPLLAQKTNQEKQRLSEELYLKFLSQQSAFEQVNKRGDGKAKAQLRNSARTQFREQMGIDLQNFTLTSAGFRER